MLKTMFQRAAKIETIMNAKDNIHNGTFIWCDETERLYIKMKDKIIGITPAKREIRQIKCKSCGAPIRIPSTGSIVTCDFCRSVYDIDSYNMDVF